MQKLLATIRSEFSTRGRLGRLASIVRMVLGLQVVVAIYMLVQGVYCSRPYHCFYDSPTDLSIALAIETGVACLWLVYVGIVLVKRLHDFGRSGWWLGAFVMIVGLIISLQSFINFIPRVDDILAMDGSFALKMLNLFSAFFSGFIYTSLMLVYAMLVKFFWISLAIIVLLVLPLSIPGQKKKNRYGDVVVGKKS